MESAIAIVLIIYFIIGMVGLAVAVLTIIAHYKLFERAGEPGWAAIVPVYNIFVISKIATGKYTMSIVYTLLMFFYMVSYFIGVMADASVLVLISFVLFYIPLIVVYAYMMYHMGTSFGRSSGWCVAMIFLSGILMIAMGFDNTCTYVGPYGKAPVSQDPYSGNQVRYY